MVNSNYINTNHLTIVFQEGKGASFVLRNMDKLNEILMDTTNATTTNFTGSNLGNRPGFSFPQNHSKLF